jgi:hypothetical protein
VTHLTAKHGMLPLLVPPPEELFCILSCPHFFRLIDRHTDTEPSLLLFSSHFSQPKLNLMGLAQYKLYIYVKVIINGIYGTWASICTLVTKESTNHVVALFISGIKWLDHWQWQSLDRSSRVFDPRDVVTCYYLCSVLRSLKMDCWTELLSWCPCEGHNQRGIH